jgi:predicted phosphate transport protein (TIGR00153 family)
MLRTSSQLPRRETVRLSLVPRERRFYQLFDQHTATMVRAAALLRDGLTDLPRLPEIQERIRELEHEGDEVTHELVRTLNRTFVTPFDREDIYSLASGLDDVLDYIEEIGDTVTLYKIDHVSASAQVMVSLLAAASLQLQQGVAKLEQLKGVEEHGIEVHRLENLCDTESRRAIADLFSGRYEALEVVKLKEFYTLLEDALDRCEDVANILEAITIKNA